MLRLNKASVQEEKKLLYCTTQFFREILFFFEHSHGLSKNYWE